MQIPDIINALFGIDLNKKEAKNLVLQNLASAPSSPVSGLIFWDSANNRIGVYNGTVWKWYEVGTNTAAMIDAHIADNTIHFTKASIDHTGILNIGTNTHANIDTHIANGTIHFTVSSIDHGSISGLGDDDHPVYSKADGTRAFTGTVAGVLPTSASHLATKAYVDSVASGLSSSLHSPVADLAACKAVGASARVDKMLMNIETLGLYRWDAESTATSNDVQVIRPTDISTDATAGRWLRLMTALSDHNNLDNLQGGAANDRQHLTTAQVTLLNAIASYTTTIGDGTNTTFSITAATHGLAIGYYDTKVLKLTTGERWFPNITSNSSTGAITIVFSGYIPAINEFKVYVRKL